jgi:hypothetical protein
MVTASNLISDGFQQKTAATKRSSGWIKGRDLAGINSHLNLYDWIKINGFCKPGLCSLLNIAPAFVLIYICI